MTVGSKLSVRAGQEGAVGWAGCPLARHGVPAVALHVVPPERLTVHARKESFFRSRKPVVSAVVSTILMHISGELRAAV